ncbi:MAG TPA: hypothetical protein VH595_17755 [Verrucomicrobiae bacterium]|jgi:hypothetical protein|nr:hypothetical protein [Verrucomicrobiae bacterium]
MPAKPDAPLSSNQQSMLDLALACHLKIADPGEHPVIRARHQAIRTKKEAAQYINEVETKIHSRRKFRPPMPTLSSKVIAAVAPKVKSVKPILTSSASSACVFVLVIFMVRAGLLSNGWNFALVTVAMFLIMMVIGVGANNRVLGVLINERNLMSLSRFQMALWTIVVLGAYFTYALVRIKNHDLTNALNVQIDSNLWILLGISTTSLVGTPLLLNTKKEKDPAASVIPKIAALTDETSQDVAANRQGTLYGNPSPADARLTDLFQGDELGNTLHVDLAKVQMFYFTIIAVIAFFVICFKAVMSGAPLADNAQLPVLPSGLVALLGVSHAGYLTSKGTSHTKTQS